MKVFRLFMMAGLMALATQANAQVTVLTADPVTIAAGAQADLVVKMDYETTENLTAWGFSLYLPEGIAPVYSEEDEGWLGEVGDINAKKVINKGVTLQEKTDGGWLCVGYADGNPKMKSTHGDLVKITLQATGEVTGQGKINGISISNDQSVSLEQGNIAEVIFPINGGEQGIQDIKVADSNVPVYNLKGVRVNAQAKGLLIQEGKKFMVK